MTASQEINQIIKKKIKKIQPFAGGPERLSHSVIAVTCFLRQLILYSTRSNDTLRAFSPAPASGY